MKIHPHSKPCGIALIIVMIITVVFMVLAGGFAYSMKVETKLARNSSMDADLEWLGRSGIEVAKWVLSQPKQGGMAFDALNQKWAGGTGETNDALVGIDLSNYELGRGKMAIKIVDCDRKFNINTVNANNTEILRQALILIGTDASETARIVNAIVDWTDPDDAMQIGSTDTESSYYMTLTPPYKAKNGPIDDLTELMLLNGITSAMFFGSGGSSGAYQRAAPRHHGIGQTPLEEPVYPVGFVDLFTTLSGGLINLNTASATVLQLVPEVDENLAQAIITTRAGPDGAEGNEDDMPFRSVGELARVPGMRPELVGVFSRYFNVVSTTFEVHVDAELDGYKRHFVSFLRREGNRMHTLFMYWN